MMFADGLMRILDVGPLTALAASQLPSMIPNASDGLASWVPIWGGRRVATNPVRSMTPGHLQCLERAGEQAIIFSRQIVVS